MIESTKAYKTADGQTFATIGEAKVHAIAVLFQGEEITPLTIVKREEQVIDILTTGPGSRPKARSVNGGKKPRKAKKSEPYGANPQTFADTAAEQKGELPKQ